MIEKKNFLKFFIAATTNKCIRKHFWNGESCNQVSSFFIGAQLNELFYFLRFICRKFLIKKKFKQLRLEINSLRTTSSVIYEVITFLAWKNFFFASDYRY